MSINLNGARTSSRQIQRTLAFLLVVAAPLGLALLDTGPPSSSWWPVAAIPIALYCIYAAGLRVWLPLHSSRPSRTRAERPSNREVDWLLLIRGLAALLVYVYHSGLVFHHDFTWGHSSWGWLVVYSPAWLGMILFFTLSGYLMGKGFYTQKYVLTRRSVASYLRNRFLRIFPLMIVVALLGIIWQTPQLLANPQLCVRLVLFGFNSFGFTSATQGDTTGAFWSLSTEWQFYLLVPAIFAVAMAIVRWAPRDRRQLLPVITLLVFGAGIAVRYYQWTHHNGATGWNPYVYQPLIDNLDVFLVGFLANWWIPRLQRMLRPHELTTSWPVILGAIYLTYSFIAYQSQALSNAHWFSVYAIVVPGAAALALVPVIAGCETLNSEERLRAVPRRKTATALHWIGALTYPVYLVHLSILYGVQTGLPDDPYLVRWLVATVLVVVAAWVLHITVEQAALNWRKSGERKPEGPATAHTGPSVGGRQAFAQEPTERPSK